MALLPLPPLDHPDAEVRTCFREMVERYGLVPEWFQVLAHAPALLFTAWDCHAPTMVAGCLPRPQRELIGYAVARANRCEARRAFHLRTLQALGYSKQRVEELTDLEQPLAGAERQALALCSFAVKLSASPEACGAHDRESLRAEGISHGEIIEAMTVTLWCNIWDRLTLAFDLSGPADISGPLSGLRGRLARRMLKGRLARNARDHTAERNPGTIENWLRKEDRGFGGTGLLPPPLFPAASVPAAIASLGPLARRACLGDVTTPATRWGLAQEALFMRAGLLDTDWMGDWIFGYGKPREERILPDAARTWVQQACTRPAELRPEAYRAALESGLSEAELVECLFVCSVADVLRFMKAAAEPIRVRGDRVPGLSGYPVT